MFVFVFVLVVALFCFDVDARMRLTQRGNGFVGDVLAVAEDNLGHLGPESGRAADMVMVLTGEPVAMGMSPISWSRSSGACVPPRARLLLG